MILMSLSYVECISSWVDLLMCRIVEFSKYYVILIYFQAAVSALLAVSVLYVEKNQNKYYVIFRKFDTYQIAFFMTCQQHWSTINFS